MADINGAEAGPRQGVKAFIDKLKKRLRPNGASGASEVVEELVEALEEQESRGDMMDGAQKAMLTNAARFNDQLRVAEVMTPRADIISIEASAALGEVARLFAESQHSRLPVYRETLDDPIGFVHVKDIITLLAPDEDGVVRAKNSDRLLTRIKRDMLYVPPSMPLPALLVKMKAQRCHIALVVDEYGGTDGLITIEDILEQIFGAIDDEHDEAVSALVVSKPGGVVEADGRASVEDVEAMIKVALKLEDHEDEVSTVAGLAAAMAAHVPQRGEVLRHPSGKFDVEVLDADARRVKKLRFLPVAPGVREDVS
jgi:CBS domain containing-hemolysin-like protein